MNCALRRGAVLQTARQSRWLSPPKKNARRRSESNRDDRICSPAHEPFCHVVEKALTEPGFEPPTPGPLKIGAPARTRTGRTSRPQRDDFTDLPTGADSSKRCGAPARTRTGRTSGSEPDDFTNLPTGACQRRCPLAEGAFYVSDRPRPAVIHQLGGLHECWSRCHLAAGLGDPRLVSGPAYGCCPHLACLKDRRPRWKSNTGNWLTIAESNGLSCWPAGASFRFALSVNDTGLGCWSRTSGLRLPRAARCPLR